MLPPFSMKPDSPSPAAHLVRFGVATSRGCFRAFLRHLWMQNDVLSDPARAAGAQAVCDAAMAKPGTQFPLGVQPWANALARALRRVARLFADEGVAIRFANSNAGTDIARVLNAFGPICADMDTELETSGFEVQLGESESSVRNRLGPYLPESPTVPHIGAARLWLPDFFSGMMHAAMWREIVADASTLKLATSSATEFFADLMKELGVEGPSEAAVEQSILAFAPKAVDYGLGQLSWMLEPAASANVEAAVLPFLRATFARDTPPSPMIAPVAVPPPPPVEKAAPVPAKPVSLNPLPTPLKPVPIAPKPATAPAPAVVTPKIISEDRTLATVGAPAAASAGEVSIPSLRPIPKIADEKAAPNDKPLIPPDDDDDEQDIQAPAVRSVRWLIAGICAVLIVVPLLPFVGGGGPDNSTTPPLNLPPEPAKTTYTGPERMTVIPAEPLSEPAAVSATPLALPRLFEQAQAFIEAAGRAKASGDNRQAAEDLSRALLIFKQEFGEQRWRDQRYTDLRNEYRAQLALLELSKEQIEAAEEILGASEPAAPEPADTPGLAKMVNLFRRGDDELARSRPKAAAENYELGLRTGLEVLGDKQYTDRTYQQHLSRYIDFLISVDLDPEELQRRLSLVKSGKKPGPLPDKKSEPEKEGLGLPKL